MLLASFAATWFSVFSISMASIIGIGGYAGILVLGSFKVFDWLEKRVDENKAIAGTTAWAVLWLVIGLATLVAGIEAGI